MYILYISGPLCTNCTYDLDVALRCGVVQGRAAAIIRGVNIGLGLKKQLNNITVAFESGIYQGGDPI